MKVTALYLAATLCLLFAGVLTFVGMHVDIAPDPAGLGVGDTVNFGEMHRQTMLFIGAAAFLISATILFGTAAVVDRDSR